MSEGQRRVMIDFGGVVVMCLNCWCGQTALIVVSFVVRSISGQRTTLCFSVVGKYFHWCGGVVKQREL